MYSEIENKITAGIRLSDDEALWCLSDEPDLFSLGRLAHMVRVNKHPHDRVTYQVDRNINYTNICTTACRFCAFSKPPGDPDGWTLSMEDILGKVKETVNSGGTGILLQGGHNPEIRFDYYTSLLFAIRARFPSIHIHAFSPPEIMEFAGFYNVTVEGILTKLAYAGLDSLPGGGAEILAEPTRSRIAPSKCKSDDWLYVMHKAHELGIKSSATMVIGFGETISERLQHLLMLRETQDHTGGFTAFIPWTFQPLNTSMGRSTLELGAGGVEYLRIQAAARLILDNIDHHQASWVTQGLRIGSLALWFGADDLSSVMMEENVVSAAGVNYQTNEEEMKKIITESGFKPRKRLTLYQDILHG